MDIYRGLPYRPLNEYSRPELERMLHAFFDQGLLALPREDRLPSLPNIDCYGTIKPLIGPVSGDHLIFLNFADYHLNERIAAAEEKGNKDLAKALRKNLDRFGIFVADVSGHDPSDNITVTYLHSAFKTSVGYELKHHGEVTAELFEIMNTNFYVRRTAPWLDPQNNPYATLVYGEILNSGQFRFLSAGHPLPLIYSNAQEQLIRLDGKAEGSTPLGIMPSEQIIDAEYFQPIGNKRKPFPINDIQLLGHGDLLLLHTDGLIEQNGGDADFTQTRLSDVLREVKNESARTITDTVIQELFAYAPQEDDVTLVVVKKV